MSRRPSSNTANRPTGPAPMMTTSVSMLSVMSVPSGRLAEGAGCESRIRCLGQPRKSMAHRLWQCGRSKKRLSAHGCEGDLEPVECGRPEDLACEPRVRLRDRHHVELVLLLLGGRMQLGQPFRRDKDVAGRAFASAAADALDGQVPVSDDFHNAPALEGL